MSESLTYKQKDALKELLSRKEEDSSQFTQKQLDSLNALSERHPELKPIDFSEYYEGDTYKKLKKKTWWDSVIDIYNKPSQLVPLVSTAIDIKELTDITALAKKFENLENTKSKTGLEPFELMEEEEIVKLLDWVRENQPRDKTFGAQVIDMLASQPAFWGEVALSGGAVTAVKKGLTATLKAGFKESLEKNLKRN